MRIAIAGGHGQIALHLARRLTERGDEVRSLVRNPDHAADVAATGAESVVCDLETADSDEVIGAVGDVDAVVFAAGAGPGSGPDRKWSMDYGGAVKLITAANANGIARYVIVSSMGADVDAPGDDTFAVYLRAKGKADDVLRASGLDYTVVRPGRLTNDAANGSVALEENGERGAIPRDDVAAVLAAVLHAPNTVGKTLDLISGDVAVEEAVKAV